jgi:hypothetical protein
MLPMNMYNYEKAQYIHLVHSYASIAVSKPSYLRALQFIVRAVKNYICTTCSLGGNGWVSECLPADSVTNEVGYEFVPSFCCARLLFLTERMN